MSFAMPLGGLGASNYGYGAYRNSDDQPAYAAYYAAPPSPVENLVAVERIRVLFPETFLWSTKTSG